MYRLIVVTVVLLIYFHSVDMMKFMLCTKLTFRMGAFSAVR